MARFFDSCRILTVSKDDFAELYENIDMNDYSIMENAKNAVGEPYEIVEFPLTKKNVDGLDYKGSYLNFYIGSEVVLVPIVVTDLFQYGGMLHCVTQQQPQQ